MLRIKLYILLVFLGLPLLGLSQNNVDATQKTADTIAIRTLNLKDKKLFEPNPKKAGMYSSILPGLGQIYNRQYWKLPIVYVGVAAAGYFLQYNFKQYRTYRQAYIYRIDTDNKTVDEFVGIYTTGDLKTLQDTYRGYIDITVLLTAVGYSVQILDAVTAAHLRNFDITPDITLRFQPVIQPNYVGAGLVMKFK